MSDPADEFHQQRITPRYEHARDRGAARDEMLRLATVALDYWAEAAREKALAEYHTTLSKHARWTARVLAALLAIAIGTIWWLRSDHLNPNGKTHRMTDTAAQVSTERETIEQAIDRLPAWPGPGGPVSRKPPLQWGYVQQPSGEDWALLLGRKNDEQGKPHLVLVLYPWTATSTLVHVRSVKAVADCTVPESGRPDGVPELEQPASDSGEADDEEDEE